MAELYQIRKQDENHYHSLEAIKAKNAAEKKATSQNTCACAGTIF
jgi:hypothetical protein